MFILRYNLSIYRTVSKQILHNIFRENLLYLIRQVNVELFQKKQNFKSLDKGEIKIGNDFPLKFPACRLFRFCDVMKRDFLKDKTVKMNDKIRRFGVVMTPLSR